MGERCCAGNPEVGMAFRRVRPPIALGNREPSTADRCAERMPTAGRDPETKKEVGVALDYRELEVWKMSMDLCEQVYGLVRQFPTDERYALGDQLRRAAVSIPSNITTV